MSSTGSSQTPPPSDLNFSVPAVNPDDITPVPAGPTYIELPVSLDFNSTVDAPPGMWRGKPVDLITDLLASLTVPSSLQGSMGRIENYDILGIVGQGAMGVVLRAFDEGLRRIVAIKLMAPHLISSASAKERFKREARSAAGVSHPNVVTVHAVSEVKGVPFLVMEYIEGQSLSQRIHSKPMDSLDVMRIAQQMASGLAAAHRQGIVHRDIKPSNIMLEDSIERVRIADFGLARVAMEQSNLTSDGQMVGTPSYMSPEQVNGEPLDPRSDLFSVGCVMYAMMTGHSPFEAPNGLAAARAVLHHEPESLLKACHEPHPILCDLIHRLLQKNPADRIRSAEELEYQLTRLIRSWDSTADSPTVRLNALPKQKPASGPKAKTATAVLIVIAAVALALNWSRFFPPPRSLEVADPGSNRGDTGVAAAAAKPSAAGVVAGAATPQRRLQVSKSGNSGYVKISDAIAAAGPDSVIEFLDEGPYSGPIQLDDPQRLRGVKIVGRQTVITGRGIEPIIRVAGVAGVTIEGLILNVAGHQHGMEIVGECPGLSFQKSVLQSLDPEKPSISLIYLHQAAAGTAEKPMELRELELRFGAVGVVLGDPETQSPIHDLRIAACKFTCAAGRTGIPLILFDGLTGIEVSRNLIETGHSAVSLSLAKADSVRNFDFSWNTLRDFDSLLSLNESSLLQDLRLRHNLLLDIDRFPVSNANVDQLAGWCSGNVWRHPPNGEQELLGRVADRREQIPLLGNSPGNADYLVPTDPAIDAGRHRGIE